MADELNDSFNPLLQDEELLSYFPQDEGTRAVVTDFIARNYDAILEEYEQLPETNGGTVISSQIFARLILSMLEKTGFNSEAREKRERERRKWAEEVLAALPELKNDSVVLHWRLQSNQWRRDTPKPRIFHEYHLTHEGELLLKEKAFWEDYHILLDLLPLLVQRYGSKLKAVIPSRDHLTFGNMYGDDIGGPFKVRSVLAQTFGNER